jgi:exodeoxyribonuclease VII large subunit
MNVRVWTISELTRRIREVLETEIDRVWISGEISGWKVHPSSGHAYFCLKDDRALLNCVAWASSLRVLSARLRPRDGLKVRAFGRITVYEPRGTYQFVVEQMLDEGEGALQAAFLQLKRKLEAEGLFAPEHKRALPRFPRRIGIVTSPSGAALRDLLRVLGARWPLAEALLRPAAVQGADAAQDIAGGIRDLNEHGGCDLLVVGRGGGSLEDLWAFNEEVVARAIYHSAVPVISAVGHETDFTIADFVADRRAATPSNAAELAVPDQTELLSHLAKERRFLRSCLERRMEGVRLRLQRLRMSRGLRRPEDLLRRGRLDLDRLSDRLREGLGGKAERGRLRLQKLERRFLRMEPTPRLVGFRHHLEQRAGAAHRACESALEQRRRRLELASARLSALGPERVLARGYAIVCREDDGRILRDAGQVSAGEGIGVRLHQARLRATVTEVRSATEDATKEGSG